MIFCYDICCNSVITIWRGPKHSPRHWREMKTSPVKLINGFRRVNNNNNETRRRRKTTENIRFDERILWKIGKNCLLWRITQASSLTVAFFFLHHKNWIAIDRVPMGRCIGDDQMWWCYVFCIYITINCRFAIVLLILASFHLVLIRDALRAKNVRLVHCLWLNLFKFCTVHSSLFLSPKSNAHTHTHTFIFCQSTSEHFFFVFSLFKTDLKRVERCNEVKRSFFSL